MNTRILIRCRSIPFSISRRFPANSITSIFTVRGICSGSKMAANTEALSRGCPLVGVVQMTSTSDKEANFEQASSLIHRAKHRGAQMVFLPECFDAVMETREQAVKESETLEGPIVTRYRALAKSLQLWLSLGGLHERPKVFDKKIYNTHLLIDDRGEIKATYSKTHLFDLDIKGGIRLKETDMTIPGPTLGPPVDTPVGKVGLGICYDMRFPEMSIALTQQGAEILTYPSAFTVPTGMAHWEVLLRSRAIENQCYVIASAQTGKHNDKRSSYGHTMVVDPWGCVIAECHDKVDVCVAEIDLQYLHKRRLEMLVWQHRRHDLYGHIQTRTSASIDSAPTYQFGQYSVKSSQVFYKTPLSIAFVNRKPVLPGHVLLTPIRPAEHFSDLTQPEIADLFTAVQTVEEVIRKHYGATSGTVAIQDGPDAGQTVKHCHVHVLPRKKGDFEDNDDIYDKLEKHDKDVAANKWRSDEDMEQEATILRALFS